MLSWLISAFPFFILSSSLSGDNFYLDGRNEIKTPAGGTCSITALSDKVAFTPLHCDNGEWEVGVKFYNSSGVLIGEVLQLGDILPIAQDAVKIGWSPEYQLTKDSIKVSEKFPDDTFYCLHLRDGKNVAGLFLVASNATIY